MGKRDRPACGGAADWSAATWEGARLEQLRRWAALPLEDAIRALEEMEDLARELRAVPKPDKTQRA